MSSLCDVFVARKIWKEPFVHNNHSCRYYVTDYSCMLTAKKDQFAVLDNGLFKCSDCSKESVMLYDYNKGICPSCYFKINKNTCQLCNKNIACASCGSNKNYSITLGDKTLCYRDTCLLPFGYITSNYKAVLNCRCSEILKYRIANLLGSDLFNEIEKHLKPELFYVFEITLCDGKRVDCTKCHADTFTSISHNNVEFPKDCYCYCGYSKN